MRLADATILITGGSQGLGRALAVYFGPRCKKMIVTARNEAGLRETQAQVTAAGGACDYAVMDLRDAASIDALAATLDTLDLLINNAADVTSRPFAETSAEEIDSLMRTNVIGPLQLTRAALPLLKSSADGSVINISSLAGYKPNAAQTVYSLSKTAVNGMSDALRNELQSAHVHVMNVALPTVSLGESCPRGAVPFARFAARLERALQNREHEVYLSPVSKWLMRLYKFYPPLARMS